MKQLVETAVKYDEDGIDIRFLNEVSWGTVKVRPDYYGIFRGVI